MTNKISISIDPTDLMDGMDREALLDAIREAINRDWPEAKITRLQIGYSQGDGWTRINGRDTSDLYATLESVDWTDESLYTESVEQPGDRRKESKMKTTDLIHLTDEDLIEAIRSDLHDSEYAADTIQDETRWVNDVQEIWTLPAYAVRIGDRVVMWTDTDEAGIDDVTVEPAAADVPAQLAEYLHGIAADLGDVMDGQHCHVCGAAIKWGGIETHGSDRANSTRGTCDCGDVWIDEDRGGWGHFRYSLLDD